MALKQPAWPHDVADHAETKLALKVLRHKRRAARRWHHMAVVAIDAIMAELMDSLPNLPLAQRPAAIASAGEEMAPFLRPDDTAAPPE